MNVGILLKNQRCAFLGMFWALQQSWPSVSMMQAANYIYCSLPLSRRVQSIHGICYLRTLLEPIPHRSQGITGHPHPRVNCTGEHLVANSAFLVFSLASSVRSTQLPGSLSWRGRSRKRRQELRLCLPRQDPEHDHHQWAGHGEDLPCSCPFRLQQWPEADVCNW